MIFLPSMKGACGMVCASRRRCFQKVRGFGIRLLWQKQFQQTQWRHQKFDLLQLSCQTTMLWGVYLRTVLKSRLIWDQPQNTYCNNLDVTTGGIRKPGLRPAMRRHTSRYRSEGFLVLLATRMHLVGLIMLCCFFAISSSSWLLLLLLLLLLSLLKLLLLFFTLSAM